MTNTVEVITSVERRRRWSLAEKERLVAASLEPGVGVSEVARQAGIHPSQLYGWRRQLCAGPRPVGFTPVQVAVEAKTAGAAAGGQIDIEFVGGIRMRISGTVDPAMLAASIAALRGERRR